MRVEDDQPGGNGSKDDDNDKPDGGTPDGAGPEKNDR